MRRSRFSASSPVSQERVWAWLFLLAFLLLALRLFQLQVLRHRSYAERALRSHVRHWTLSAPRGEICDRQGRVLALSVPSSSVFADPSLSSRNLAVYRPLMALLGLPEETLSARLREKREFVWLRRWVDDGTAERVAALKLKGIGILTEDKRAYPNGGLASQTLGFVGEEGKGLAGVEASFDRILAGRPGRATVEVDARGEVIPGRRVVQQEPRPGREVMLTLDLALQEIVEAELRKAVKEAHAVGGTAIVIDPYTGEILALANEPSFDPNTFCAVPPERWANRAVMHVYEPGSTFKLVMASAALENHIIGPADTIVCHGSLPVGNRTIHCVLHHGSSAHGPLTLEGVIEESCNVGAATLALRLGPERYARALRALGFGQPSGLELGGEACGSCGSPEQWSQIRLANLAFGQGVSVTPIQLLRAYCAVANGGYLTRPHLVRCIAQRDGSWWPAKQGTGTRVLSPDVAAQLRRMLVKVVENGTGKAARLAGYTIAGKTGTAQKPTPGLGYRSGRYIGSFVGFVPAERPRLALLVMIDEPAGIHYGGVVAAPAFREICRAAIAYLGLPPEPPILQVGG